MRQLGDSRGLAGAVDTDHQNYLRTGKGDDIQRLGHGAQDRGDFFSHGLTDRGFVRALVEPVTRQLGANPRCGTRAKVGQDQGVLDLVELRIVKPGL